jgi:hypothetical protein
MVQDKEDVSLKPIQHVFHSDLYPYKKTDDLLDPKYCLAYFIPKLVLEDGTTTAARFKNTHLAKAFEQKRDLWHYIISQIPSEFIPGQHLDKPAIRTVEEMVATKNNYMTIEGWRGTSFIHDPQFDPNLIVMALIESNRARKREQVNLGTNTNTNAQTNRMPQNNMNNNNNNNNNNNKRKRGQDINLKQKPLQLGVGQTHLEITDVAQIASFMQLTNGVCYMSHLEEISRIPLTDPTNKLNMKYSMSLRHTMKLMPNAEPVQMNYNNYCDRNPDGTEHSYKFPTPMNVYGWQHHEVTSEARTFLRHILPTPVSCPYYIQYSSKLSEDEGESGLTLADRLAKTDDFLMYQKMFPPDGSSPSNDINLVDIVEMSLPRDKNSLLDSYIGPKLKSPDALTAEMMKPMNDNFRSAIKCEYDRRMQRDGTTEEKRDIIEKWYTEKMKEFWKNAIMLFSRIWSKTGTASPVVKTAVAWGEDYLDKHKSMYVPFPKMTTNLSYWNDFQVYFMMIMEMVVRCSSCHAMALVTWFSMLNSSDPNREEKLHVLASGQAAVSKSFVLNTIRMFALPETIDTLTYKTMKSDTSDGNYDSACEMYHEVPRNWMGFNPNAYGKGGAAAAAAAGNDVEMFKERLTGGMVRLREMFFDDEGRRRERKNTRYSNGTFIMNTNEKLYNMAEEVLSRFYIAVYQDKQRKGRNIIDLICDIESHEFKQLEKACIDRLRRLHWFVLLINEMIKCGPLLPVNTKYSTTMCQQILAQAGSYAVPGTTSPRSLTRVLCAVRVAVLLRAILLVFSSAISPFKDVAFQLDHMITVQLFLVDDDPSILISVLGLLEDQYEDKIMPQVIEALQKKFFSLAAKNVANNANEAEDILHQTKTQKEKQRRKERKAARALEKAVKAAAKAAKRAAKDIDIGNANLAFILKVNKELGGNESTHVNMYENIDDDNVANVENIEEKDIEEEVNKTAQATLAAMQQQKQATLETQQINTQGDLDSDADVDMNTKDEIHPTTTDTANTTNTNTNNNEDDDDDDEEEDDDNALADNPKFAELNNVAFRVTYKDDGRDILDEHVIKASLFTDNPKAHEYDKLRTIARQVYLNMTRKPREADVMSALITLSKMDIKIPWSVHHGETVKALSVNGTDLNVAKQLFIQNSRRRFKKAIKTVLQHKFAREQPQTLLYTVDPDLPYKFTMLKIKRNEKQMLLIPNMNFTTSFGKRMIQATILPSDNCKAIDKILSGEKSLAMTLPYEDYVFYEHYDSCGLPLAMFDRFIVPQQTIEVRSQTNTTTTTATNVDKQTNVEAPSADPNIRRTTSNAMTTEDNMNTGHDLNEYEYRHHHIPNENEYMHAFYSNPANTEAEDIPTLMTDDNDITDLNDNLGNTSTSNDNNNNNEADTIKGTPFSQFILPEFELKQKLIKMSEQLTNEWNTKFEKLKAEKTELTPDQLLLEIEPEPMKLESYPKCIETQELQAKQNAKVDKHKRIEAIITKEKDMVDCYLSTDSTLISKLADELARKMGRKTNYSQIAEETMMPLIKQFRTTQEHTQQTVPIAV